MYRASGIHKGCKRYREREATQKGSLGSQGQGREAEREAGASQAVLPSEQTYAPPKPENHLRVLANSPLTDKTMTEIPSFHSRWLGGQQ